MTTFSSTDKRYCVYGDEMKNVLQSRKSDLRGRYYKNLHGKGHGWSFPIEMKSTVDELIQSAAKYREDDGMHEIDLPTAHLVVEGGGHTNRETVETKETTTTIFGIGTNNHSCETSLSTSTSTSSTGNEEGQSSSTLLRDVCTRPEMDEPNEIVQHVEEHDMLISNSNRHHRIYTYDIPEGLYRYFYKMVGKSI